MEFLIKTGDPEKQRSACVIVGVFQARRMSEAAKQLDKAGGGIITDILRRGDIDGEAGQTLMLFRPAGVQSERVLLVGCGKQQDFDAAVYRKAVYAAAAALKNGGAVDAVSYLIGLPLKSHDVAWKVSQAVIATQDALYVFDQLKSDKKSGDGKLRKLTFALGGRAEIAAAEQARDAGLAIAQGVRLAKDLGNLPGNICTPTYLADQAKALKKTHRKLEVDVLDEKAMEKLGMGALLSVSRGSEQPAKLIVIEHRGADKNSRPIVLVGKGITFDTGGISIKPSPAMDEMKFDMCGAASVFGALSACAQMRLPLNVIGIVASAENMPGGRASKPGDIVTTMSGQTVEILNTDAEGRLVLCDALTYAERYNPAAVIDIATLTGACIVALGNHPAGLLSNDQPLAETLLTAGQTSGDRAWQLPLWEDYQEQLNSNFADMANIGGKGAGTITAACFLSRFTRKYHWAHLDIAGVAWHSGEKKGATGRPVPLLMEYLMSQIDGTRDSGLGTRKSQ